MTDGRRKSLRRAAGIFLSVAAAVVSAVVIAAFILPVLRTFFPSGADSAAGVSGAVSAGKILRVTAHTLFIAAGSTLVAALVGIPAAFFTSRRDFLFRRVMISFCAVPLCIPPLITALGYVGFFGISGTVNSLLRVVFGRDAPQVHFLYSSAGIIVAQGFYNFPLVMRIVSDAWEMLPDEQADAARLLGTGEARIFRTITLRALAPAVGSACIPVFLFCFFSFLIVLIFSPPGTSTLEVEIYQAVRTTLDVRSASAFAAAETLAALAVVLLYSLFIWRNLRASAGADFSAAGKKRPRPAQALYEPPTIKAAEIIVFAAVMILSGIFFVCPLLSIVLSGFTERTGGTAAFSCVQFLRLFSSAGFYSALLNSLSAAFFTALLCVVCGFTCSCASRISGFGGNFFVQTVPLFPMAVSSVVTGWGITALFHRGSPFLLVLMQAALFWPVAYRQIQAAVDAIPWETERAALLMSCGRTELVWRFYLPQARNALLSAFCCCFAVSMGDTTLPLMLSVPRFDTLSLYTYRLAGSYRFRQASASGTVLGILCMAVFMAGGIFSVSERNGRNSGRKTEL